MPQICNPLAHLQNPIYKQVIDYIDVLEKHHLSLKAERNSDNLILKKSSVHKPVYI